MSKKLTLSANRPSKSAADEWISQGKENSVESPTSTPVSSLSPAPKTEKMKRLSLDLPTSMHKTLMTYCVQHDMKAADLLRKLIREACY